MRTNLPETFCFKHPENGLTHFCTVNDCEHKLLCETCYNLHDTTHTNSVRHVNFFFKYDIASIIERIKNAKTKKNVVFQQKIAETEKLFDQMRYKLEETIFKTKEEAVRQLLQAKNQQDEQFSLLLKEFEKHHQYFVSISKKESAESPNKPSSPRRYELESFIKLSQELKDHKSLCEISSYSNNFHVEDLEAFLEKMNESISAFANSIIESQTKINLPSPPEHFPINNLRPERYVENHAPVLWHSVEFLADKNILVIGDLKGGLTLWSESNDFKKLFKVKAHNDWISNVKYSESKNLVISGSLDQNINIYKVLPGPTLKLLKVLKHSPANWVRGLLILDEKNILLSSGNLPNICVWDLNSLQLKGIIDTKGKGSTGSEMTYIPNLNLLAVGFLQGIIGLYDLKTNKEVATIKTGYHGCRINSMQYLKREGLLVAGVAPGKIKCWKLTENNVEFTREYEVPGRQPALIFPVKNEQSLLVASFTEEIYNLSLDTGKLVQLSHTGLSECVTLRVIPKKKKLVIGDFGSRKIAVMTYE